jgi:ATP-binding cassette, subfamily F, member 3
VFVSHDRYFIDKLATRVFEIGEGEVRIFPGNYEDYLWRKEGGQIDLTLPSAPTLADVPGLNGGAPKPQPQSQKRLNPMKLQKLQDRARELENSIAAIEQDVAALEASLSDFRSADDSARTAALIDQRRTELQSAMKEWEDVSETIETSA